ncbi:hypothetical protein BC332_04125 [Capsicum chinense]|nr:hypothetical protein BC332_04125 [Capsicum chinense]
MDIIELSYKHLPSYLKQCFLYFGMFLEDEEVSVKKWIRIWIGEGFVQSNEMKSAEIIAMNYLVDLVTRNLVMVARRFPLGDMKTVRLHDLHFIKWLHPTQRVHTLRLYAQNINKFHNLTDCELNKFIIASGVFSSDLFKSTLTVLDLQNVEIDASTLEDGTSLIHLRYLSIFSNFNEIPSDISNLTNLETLVARPKSGTLTLPGSIWDLINLKYIDTSEAMIHFNSVEAEKEDVFKLEKLESFSKVVIVNGDDTCEMCNKAPNLLNLELLTVEHVISFYGYAESVYVEQQLQL